MWTGTIACSSAPTAAVFTVLVGVPNLGQPWGSWLSTATFGPVQAWGMETVTVTATGLTAGATYQLLFIGVSEDATEAELVYPSVSTAVVQSSTSYKLATFVAAAAANTGAGTSARSVTVALPSGVIAGDLLLVQIVKQPGTDTFAFTIGGAARSFTTARDDSTTGSPSNCRATLLYAQALAGDGGANLVVTFSGGADLAAVAVLVLRSVNVATPVQASGATVSTGNVTSIATPSVTTTIANQLILSCYGKVDSTGAGAVLTIPAGTSQLVANSSQGYAGLEAVDEYQASAGNTSTRAATTSTAAAAIAQVVALQPAAA